MCMAKILLVEDDKELAATIIAWLSAEHHQVIHVENGLDGYERMQQNACDVVVLDWQLPDIAGVEICKKYRNGRGMLPVIMLTGKAEINDRTTGLDAGADDYLTKPFSLKELAARIRALLRRPANVTSNLLEVGELSLDPVKYRLTKKGAEVQLMPRDFALLEFFMRNVDHVFSADVLLQRVWSDDSEATPEAVRTAIKRIRKKLDDDASEENSVIENIPRVGYRMRSN